MPHIFEKSKLASFNFDEEKQNLHIQWEDGHESDFKIKDILDWSIAVSFILHTNDQKGPKNLWGHEQRPIDRPPWRAHRSGPNLSPLGF